jgi:murein DD-endopeptidase MepM/ murein hydrolase activator NlpD
MIITVSAPTVLAQEGEATPLSQTTNDNQTDSEIPKIHEVQEGETLYNIAEEYGTTIEALQLLNNISDPALLYIGQQLIIPGGGGDSVPTIYTIRVGDTLQSIAADYRTTLEDVAQANRLINPDDLVAGRPITVISRTGSADPKPVTGTPRVVGDGDTLLSIAAEFGMSPAELVLSNDLTFPVYLYPGQRLLIPGEDRYQYLHDPWKRIEMYTVPIGQGQSGSIYVESAKTGTPSGQFAGQTLIFTPIEDGYIALFGLDAFTEPGRPTLEITGGGENPWRPFVQSIQVLSSGYGIQYIDVPEELAPLLAPEVRAQEDEFLVEIYTQFTDTALWDGPFTNPITNTVISARYGDARSYNQGPVEIFHTGIDFIGAIGTPIYAPAAGHVVFSNTLTIRGNTLIIDHGLGLMTGYYHLSSTHVAEGDLVEAGQLIAEGGSTGLSTGPHLHWDLRIMNAAVDGLQWIEEDVTRRVSQLADTGV